VKFMLVLLGSYLVRVSLETPAIVTGGFCLVFFVPSTSLFR